MPGCHALPLPRFNVVVSSLQGKTPRHQEEHTLHASPLRWFPVSEDGPGFFFFFFFEIKTKSLTNALVPLVRVRSWPVLLPVKPIIALTRNTCVI